MDTQKPDDGRPLVNYIWVNDQKTVTDFSNPICAIEMGNIKCALDNANKYPGADFNIWVDKKLLDDYSLLCLKCFIRDNARHGNFVLHDLQEVSDYASDSYFELPQAADKELLRHQFEDRSGFKNIYSRGDLARILVLDHCMKLSPERNRIIYSDIDCPDIRLRETLPVINQYGVAVHDEPDGTIHHGYIGVATDNTNIRQHFKTLKSTTQADAHRSGMGSTAFKEFLEALGMPIETWRKNIALPNLLPEMRTSPPPLTYTPPSADLKAWRVAHQISQIRGAPALLVLSNGLSPNK